MNRYSRVRCFFAWFGGLSVQPEVDGRLAHCVKPPKKIAPIVID